MDSFLKLIKKRRSTRKFTEEPISQEHVVSLFKAALMSPSSKKTNAWQFIAVDQPELIKKLAEAKENGSAFLAGAPLVIAVVADPLQSDVWIEDASIASIFLQLTAEDLGLGSCWVQIRERFTATGTPSDEYVRELLNIPLQLQVLSLIAVGHKASERKPFDEEKLQWEKIHINQFGNQE